MKRSTIVFICIILICFLGGLVTYRYFSYRLAKISISPGDVEVITNPIEGEKVFVHIMVKNQTRFSMEILEIKKSCECLTTHTKSPFTPKNPILLEAGESLPVTVMVDTKQRRGSFSSSIYIIFRRLGDKKTELVSSTISMRVRPSVRVEPLGFVFADTPRGKTVAGEFFVLDGLPNPGIQIDHIETSDPSLNTTVELSENSEHDNVGSYVLNTDSPFFVRYRVRFTLVTESNEKIIDERIILYTDSKMSPRIVIPIICYVNQQVFISPSSLALDAKDIIAGCTRNVYINITNECHTISVLSKPDWVSADLLHDKTSIVTLELNILPTHQTLPKNNSVVLVVNGQTYTIPIMIY